MNTGASLLLIPLGFRLNLVNCNRHQWSETSEVLNSRVGGYQVHYHYYSDLFEDFTPQCKADELLAYG